METAPWISQSLNWASTGSPRRLSSAKRLPARTVSASLPKRHHSSVRRVLHAAADPAQVIGESAQLAARPRFESVRGGNHTRTQDRDAGGRRGVERVPVPASVVVAAAADVDHRRESATGAMCQDDGPESVDSDAVEHARQTLLGEAVGQVQHEGLVIDEAGQRRQRLAEALAGKLAHPGGRKAPVGITPHGLARVVGNAVARHYCHLADASVLEPLERVTHERAVRDGQERRHDAGVVTVRFAGEHHGLGGVHGSITRGSPRI